MWGCRRVARRGASAARSRKPWRLVTSFFSKVRSARERRSSPVPSRTSRGTSPTFALVNEYPIAQGTLLHADLYRLRGPTLEDEVTRLALRERIVEGAILIAEWAEDAERAIGIAPCLMVRLAAKKGDSRAATLSGDLLRTLGPILERQHSEDDLLRRARSF